MLFLYTQKADKYLPEHDSSVAWLEIIWEWFQMQWHFDFLGSCCCFTKQGGMGMLGGHSFKNSLFFMEHISYVTQAVSKCKKM